jgi:hypothetical protein
MKQNIGAMDRGIRLVAGLALILLALAGYIGAWGYIGIVPLATALLNWCPLYQVFGIDSCKHDASAS